MASRGTATSRSSAAQAATALLLGVLALAALVPALAAPGLLPGAVAQDRWFLTAVSVGLVAAAIGWRRAAPGWGLMAAFVLTGGAAQLYLTDPLWFPAPRLRPDGPVDMAMMALIGVEGLAALAVILRRGPSRLWHWMRRGPGLGAVVLLLLTGAAFSISVTPYAAHGNWSDYAVRLVAGGVLAGLHLTALAALMTLRPPFYAEGGIHPVYGAALALLTGILLGYFAYQNMPHVEDELAYLFQARTFASGHLAVAPPAEAIRPGLVYYLIEMTPDRWISVTAPGWPAALALGVAAGMPWLVNPVLAGMAVLFGYAIVRRHGGAATAGIAALMMAVSPWFAGSAGGLMTHSLTTALILFSWWAILRGRETRDHLGTGWLIAAGLAMGWVFATRPLDGLLAGVLTGLWILLSGRGAILRALAYGAGCIVAGSGFLFYNRAMTGHFLSAPLDAYLVELWGAGANAFGFGDRVGPPGGWGALDLSPGHTPAEGLVNTLNNLSALQFEMMGWLAGSLILVLLWAAIATRRTRFDRAMVIVVLVTIAAMFPYWFAGSFYIGPRYWFLAAFPLIHLSARGAVALDARLTEAGQPGRVGPALILLAVFSALVFTPWRGVTKYYEYGNYNARIAQADRAGTFGNAVVLVTGKQDPGSYLYLNRPGLPADRPIFVADTGTLDEAAIRAAYPGRPLVRYTAD